jgi:hypothetical protein
MLTTKSFLFSLLTLLMIYLAIKMFIIRLVITIRELYEIRNHGKVSDGIIVSYKIDKDPDGVQSYLQEVEYRVNDKVIKTTIPHPVKEKPQIGDKVLVHFTEQSPERGIVNIDQTLLRNILPLTFLIVVILIMVIVSIRLLL